MDSTIKFLSEVINDEHLTTDLKDKISYADKVKNDFAWVKSKIDYYDRGFLMGDKANYNLFNGVYDEKDYESVMKPYGLNTDLIPKLNYIDIISNPLKELIGEERYRHFDPIVVAVNSEAANTRLKQKTDQIKEYLIQKIEGNEPEKDLEYIESYMKKSFKLPEEHQAQALLNYLLRKLNLRFNFNQLFKDLIICGKAIVLPTIRNGIVDIEIINPTRFKCIKPQDSYKIEDSEACIYEEWLTYTQLVNKFDITDKELSELDSSNFTNIILSNDMVLMNDLDEEVEEKLYRVLNVTFATLKKIKFVTRLNETILVDETYKPDPILDTDVEEAWIREIWGGTKINSKIYKNLGPVDNQYTNFNDPYEVKQPYFGVVFEERNSKLVSILDRGKNWAYMFNYVFHQLEQAIGINLGNVMVANFNSIPSGWSPEKWLTFLKATKIAMIDPTQEGALGTDPQYWKSINMSMGTDINLFINLLTYCERQCYKALGTNENRLGTVGVSETVSNNIQKIQQSVNITEGLFDMFDRFKETVCTRLIELAKIAYKDSEEKMVYILDDLSQVILDLNTENLSLSEFGCFVSINIEDYNMVNMLRNHLNTLIANSNGDMRLVVKALKTKNPATIEALVNEQYDTNMKMKQAEQELNKELQEQMKKEKELDRNHEIRLALIRAMGYLNDSDVDMNKVPDILEIEKFNKEYGLKSRELDIRERELVENNKSEAADRALEREKILMTNKNNKNKK